MDIKDPEEQQLEDEPVKPAEDISETSDDPVLTESEESEPEKEIAADKSQEQIVELENNVEESETKEEEAPDNTLEAIEELNQEEETETSSDPGNESVSEEELEPTTELKQDDDPSNWFVIHCYSGYENKVRHNLEQRIETMGMKDMIFDVVVPTQEEVEVRDGKRRTVERHIFPGYVLVNMILTEESWYVVRNTPGVTGFVGMGNTPTPLRADEVSQIVKRMEADAPMVKVTFKVGERVRIIDGPFNDFRGIVSEIDMERTKVRVMVSFFGRETPVELDFLQVEKA